MLESITLTNFQCHKHLKIQLDPLITCLTGASDHGKTAVLRALTWLSFNKPRGDEFIRWGEKFVRVCLQIDGRSLRRSKGGKQGNLYRIDGESPLVSFKSDVPATVQQILNLGELNFQQQLAAPYWFLKTPGEVSREMNSIINLSQVDKTLSNIASELRKSRIVANVSEERLKTAKEQRSKLSWVVEADVKLRKIEKLDTTLERTRLERARLNAINERVRESVLHVLRLSRAILTGKKATSLCESLLEAQQQRQQLHKLNREVRKSEYLSSIYLPTKEIAMIDRLAKLLRIIQEKQRQLGEVQQCIKLKETEQCTVRNDLLHAMKTLQRRTKGKCPFCQRKLPPKLSPF